MSKTGIRLLIVLSLWLLTLWVCYWTGYRGGFISAARGEYALTSANIMYNIGLMEDIHSHRVTLPQLGRSLEISVESQLATATGLKKLIDDEYALGRALAYSLFDTPSMAYTVRKDRQNVRLIDIPEIHQRYRQVVAQSQEKRARE
jgi:hypothetical protein